MGNKGLFPVAPCRVLSLVLSFASKESTTPPRGGSPTTRAGVGASIPTGAGVCACGHTKGLSARPLETFGHRSWRETHRTASPNPHCSRRIMPPVGNFLRQSCCSPTQAGGFPLAPCTPSDRSRRNFDGMNRELSSGANHRRGPYPPPSNPIALRKEPPSCRQPSMKS